MRISCCSFLLLQRMLQSEYKNLDQEGIGDD